MSRIQTFDLKHHGFERVARQCLLAMRGEPGAFAVYVPSTGLARVTRWDYSANPGDCVGVYTAAVEPEILEEDLRQRLHDLQSPEKRRPGRPLEV